MEVPHPEILVSVTSLGIIIHQYKPTSRDQLLYREHKQAINTERIKKKKKKQPSEKRLQMAPMNSDNISHYFTTLDFFSHHLIQYSSEKSV